MSIEGTSENFDSVTNNPGGKPSGKNPGQFLQFEVNPLPSSDSTVGAWMEQQRAFRFGAFYETRFPASASFADVDDARNFGDFLMGGAALTGFNPGN